MEYIIEHVIEYSIEWNSSIFVDAFQNFSFFKPFLGFLIFFSTNSFSYIFMFPVWHFLLVIEKKGHEFYPSQPPGRFLNHCCNHWGKKNHPQGRNLTLIFYDSVVKFNDTKYNDTISPQQYEIKHKIKSFLLTWSRTISYIIWELCRIILDMHTSWIPTLFT